MSAEIQNVLLVNNALLVALTTHSFIVSRRPTIKAGFFIKLLMSKDPAVLFYTADFRQGTMLDRKSVV